MGSRNLFLVAYDDARVAEVFAEIAGMVNGLVSDVRARVLFDRRYRWRRYLMGLRPSLFFSPLPLFNLRPRRGRVFCGRSMPKSEQFRVLEAAGLPVPRYVVMRAGERPDLSGFGPYVVVKPDLGLRGAHVRIMRRERVHWKEIPSPIHAPNTDLLVQEFVYTGEWPVSFRVATLFGEILYALRGEGNHERRPLLTRQSFTGQSIVATARDAGWELSDDLEMFDLARRVAGAFPDVPLLGVDLVRDADTRECYVLETNPGGWTWHIGSHAGEALQAEQGIDLASQFDALRVATHVLIERARADAE